jgi:hypothetical protein
MDVPLILTYTQPSDGSRLHQVPSANLQLNGKPLAVTPHCIPPLESSPSTASRVKPVGFGCASTQLRADTMRSSTDLPSTLGHPGAPYFVRAKHTTSTCSALVVHLPGVRTVCTTGERTVCTTAAPPGHHSPPPITKCALKCAPRVRSAVSRAEQQPRYDCDPRRATM